MRLVNGAQPCNVFWQVGSSATLGTTTDFAGNILALTSITMNDGVKLNGRALARNGAVTMINDTITAPHCATAAVAGGVGELDVVARAARRPGRRRQPGPAAEPPRRAGARRRRGRPHARHLDPGPVDPGAVDPGAVDAGAVDEGAVDEGAVDRGQHRRAVGARHVDLRGVPVAARRVASRRAASGS